MRDGATYLVGASCSSISPLMNAAMLPAASFVSSADFAMVSLPISSSKTWTDLAFSLLVLAAFEGAESMAATEGILMRWTRRSRGCYCKRVENVSLMLLFSKAIVGLFQARRNPATPETLGVVGFGIVDDFDVAAIAVHESWRGSANANAGNLQQERVVVAERKVMEREDCGVAKDFRKI